MKLIIDANIIISGLIKDSITRKIILSPKFEYFSPEFLLKELNKYIPEIVKKSNLSEKEINILIQKFLEKITIISADNYKQYLDKSFKIIGLIDEKDVSYIALALLVKNDGIWTNDNHFKKQARIEIFSTSDLIKFFK